MSQSENRSESPPSPIPDKITAIRAWRSWALREDGRLFSLNAGIGGRWIWPLDRPLEALCLRVGHDAPAEDCTCGIYAHKDRNWIISTTQGMGLFVGAVGIVKLWGRIIEAERGYRAQYAEPEMIAVYDLLGQSFNTAKAISRVFSSTVFGLIPTPPQRPQNIGFFPTPPQRPQNIGAIRRSRGQCEHCGARLNINGLAIPEAKEARCQDCPKPTEPEPEPEQLEPLTGLTHLVAANYPRCVVMSFAKMQTMKDLG